METNTARRDLLAWRRPVPGPQAASRADVGDALAAEAARLWRLLLAGQPAGPAEALALFEAASRAQRGPLVIEATLLRALVLPAATDEPLALVRRACRMAQAEGLPDEEVLTHLVLARMRRRAGRPHLALHILRALARMADPSHRAWIGWELLLAGGATEALAAAAALAGDEALAATPAARTLRAGLALLTAARAKDAKAFARAATAIAEAAPTWPELRAEALALPCALDPRSASEDAEVLDWRAGRTAQVPHGLHGVGVSGSGARDEDAAVAWVVAQPADSPGWAGATGARSADVSAALAPPRAQRALAPGLDLYSGARRLAATAGEDTGGNRTETGLAVLALAAAGLSRADFFRTVYGFAFAPTRHDGVLRVLVHRMRQRLGDAGEIAWTDEHGLRLGLRVAIAIPDARCDLPSADRVLRTLASLGELSAQEAALKLRMPLRTVQTALSQLVTEGACHSAREGRRVTYRVHDTTFTAITLARARAPVGRG
jgi:DNA-binding transcriptional ArsR family regulator